MFTVLSVAFYVRIRLLSIPLERDEGEYAYIGQLLLKGIPPFTHAYTMKLPGTSVVYAFFMFLFGQTPTGIHAGLLIVNGTCIYLVYLLTKRLFDSSSAIYSCTSYAVLSLSWSVLGYFAHATQFVVLFALAGFELLLRPSKNPEYMLFISGISFGLAVTMKQHAIILLIYAALYLMRGAWKNHSSDKKSVLMGSFLFLLGTIIPYSLIVIWMIRSGSFTDFWLWTVQYAREYTSLASLTSGCTFFTDNFGKILKIQLFLWLFAGLGFVLFCLKKICCTDRFFVSGFLAFSFLSICPGLYFRPHYFILLLPAVSLMTGVGINHGITFFSSAKMARFSNFMPPFLFIMATSSCFFLERDNFFVSSPLDVSRDIYTECPFPEALQIANYIKNNSSPEDTIAVLGSEPEIYFYADRLSATGHIYMYGLTEDQPYAERMQKQMISEIEVAQPRYIVKVFESSSWMLGKSTKQYIFDWEERYVKDFYDKIGAVDIIGARSTLYFWGEKARSYRPISRSFVTIYKKKDGM